MNYNHTDINYLTLDAEQKDFVQRLAFLDYVEEYEKCSFHNEDCLTIRRQLQWELAHYEYHEDYETCQLIKDILTRYKTDLIQFDN